MRILIVAEHDGATLRSTSLSCFTFALSIAEATSGEASWLILGHQLDNVAAEAAKYAPAIAVDSPALSQPLAEPLARVIATVVHEREFDLVCAAASTFSKDCLSRAAALLGGAMASDVTRHVIVGGRLELDSPQYAGAVTATLRLIGSPQIVTVRASAYSPAQASSTTFSVDRMAMDAATLACRGQSEGVKTKRSARPDVTEARVVVSGGRALKNSGDFEQLVGRLADVLGGAAGSSRALVDAGITPNELQVGQTGKIVAPEIYFALGISGAVQHLAGMKNSRTIVAINSDPDAPIFDVADFGLVGDVYAVVPELIEKLERRAGPIRADIFMPPEPAPLTREIFGNVPGWAQSLFYVLSAIAIAAWVYGIVRRALLWRKGRSGDGKIRWSTALRRLLQDVLLQRRVWGRGLASVAHALLFSGFIVLLIGTTLIAIEHLLAAAMGRPPTDPVFHKGVYFGVYEIVMDTFGIALVAGCCLFLQRRWRGDGSYARSPADVGVLILLIVIGVSGYVLEGLRIIHAQTPLPGLSPVGYLFARVLATFGIGPAAAGPFHIAVWWSHAILSLAFIALMPYTRLLHALAGTVNLAIRDHVLGVMKPVSLAEFEATGQLGAATLADFSYRQLIELDACVSCGRCEDACPAFEAGKPLSPRNVVQDLVGVLSTGDTNRNVHGEPIAAETLWSCTTCGACADVCPLGISPMRMITDMRRHLIGEGALRGSPAVALQKTDRAENPWGMAATDRMAWAAGLNVPLASTHSEFEVLYWVGCAAAYDRRVQKIARSMVRLLQAADVKFAVLGPEERCTGEAARRMGDELLFQTLAERNVSTLARHRVRRIIAHCPHCLNSLRNDYLQVGGCYEVVHHSQLLDELIRDGRLKTKNDDARMTNDESYRLSAIGSQPIDVADSRQPTADGPSITYHDPCYLARMSGIVDAPRAVLSAATDAAGELPILELPRNRRQTSCCGGGGGRMWFDDAFAQRVGQSRVREIAQSGAGAVAVSCPFCLIMLGDGLAAQNPEVRVRDIAEVLAEALLGPET